MYSRFLQSNSLSESKGCEKLGYFLFPPKSHTVVIKRSLQYIPRNVHTVFALLCFVEVIHWLIFPYPSGLLRWHCGNLTIAPVPAKQPWWIWINTSCEFIMKDCITTTKQSTTKPCAYFLGYTVRRWQQWTKWTFGRGLEYYLVDIRNDTVDAMMRWCHYNMCYE